MSGQDGSCGDCRFFKMHTESGPAAKGVGWCRYNAPSVPVKQLSPSDWNSSSDTFRDYMFPPARKDQWCGKYEEDPADKDSQPSS